MFFVFEWKICPQIEIVFFFPQRKERITNFKISDTNNFAYFKMFSAFSVLNFFLVCESLPRESNTAQRKHSRERKIPPPPCQIPSSSLSESSEWISNMMNESLNTIRSFLWLIFLISISISLYSQKKGNYFERII